MKSNLFHFSLILFFVLFFSISINGQAGVSTTPFSNAPSPFTKATHPLKPTALWGNLKAPFPTNSFWTNTILENGQTPVEELPYLVRLLPTGMQVSSPGRTASSTFIITTFTANMAFSTVETPQSRNMINYDLLSFQFAWNYASASSSMRIPVVRGSPFMTAFFQNVRPVLTTIHAILSVNGNNQNNVAITGEKFKIVLNNGQTWIVYTTAGQTISLQRSGNTLTASSAFSGPLRLALLPEASFESTLDQSKEKIAIGGDVSFEVVSGNSSNANDVSKIKFSWKTQGTGNLLMLALPHHVDSLVSPASSTLTKYQTMKGFMSAVLGDEWTLQEKLTKIQFFSNFKINDPQKLADIRNSLQRDQSTQPVAPDPYFFGKQIALMGRHALIADELNESQIAKNVRTNMKSQLDAWFRERNANPLRFDDTWKGICSANGLKGPGNDFGQGFYNDHHFHYGYFLYAIAALGKEDPEFLTTFNDQILSLARDVANPSTTDPFFPVTRNKDWFVGHSWASGLFVFGDSKNQESTSEAINAYYGLYLLGISMKNQQMADLGRVMLATEIRSTHKYWQITSNSTIYEDNFSRNKVVGILWSTKVDYATFFGANVEFIHGIQMLPFTPISEELLPASWIREELPVVSTALTRKTPPLDEGWRGFIIMAQAIIQKDAAYTAASNLRRFDDGNSRTNTFYWIASRPNPKDLQSDLEEKKTEKRSAIVGPLLESEMFEEVKGKVEEKVEKVKETIEKPSNSSKVGFSMLVPFASLTLLALMRWKRRF